MSDSSAALKAPPLAESEIDRHAAEIKPAWEGVSKSNRPPVAGTLTEVEFSPMEHVPPPPMTATDMDRAFQAASLAPRPEAPVFDDDYQLPQKRPLSPVAKKVIFGVLGLAGLVTVGGFVRYLVAPKADEETISKPVVTPKVETPAVQAPVTQPPPMAKEPPPPPEPVKADPKPEPAKVEPAKPEPVRAPEPVKAATPAPKPVAAPAPKPVAASPAAPKPAAKPTPVKPRSGLDRDNPF